jgi:hypothetical protein
VALGPWELALPLLMRFAASQLIFGRISIFSCANDVIEGKKGPLLYFIFFLNK